MNCWIKFWLENFLLQSKMCQQALALLFSDPNSPRLNTEIFLKYIIKTAVSQQQQKNFCYTRLENREHWCRIALRSRYRCCKWRRPPPFHHLWSPYFSRKKWKPSTWCKKKSGISILETRSRTGSRAPTKCKRDPWRAEFAGRYHWKWHISAPMHSLCYFCWSKINYMTLGLG